MAMTSTAQPRLLGTNPHGSTFHFRCDTCDYAVDIYYLPREYVLDQARSLGMRQSHVWCCACGEVTPAEVVVETPREASSHQERIDTCRRELDDAADDPFLHSVAQVRLQESIQDAENFASWLAFRG